MLKKYLYLLEFVFVFLFLSVRFTDAQVQVSTDPNFKVAFIGDTGLGNNFTSTLNNIKTEGAQAVMHQGDFDYQYNPAGWWGRIDQILGSNFPYFVSVGNHDSASWNEGCSDPDGCYAKFQKDRLARIGVNIDNPDLNDQLYSVTYKGLRMVFVGLQGNQLGASTYAPFIQNQLQSDNHIWKVCSWHKNQSTLQLGTKGDEMGWEVYETCRQQGAIIATAHEHTYERTKTLTNIQALAVDASQHPVVNGVPSNPNSVLVAPGKTFVFVSGSGGQGLRNQDRCLPTTYPYGGGSGCNYIWASVNTSDQGGDFGALFITFNVDGNPNKARGYFKENSGRITDQFEITKSSTPVTIGPTQPITIPPTNPLSPTSTFNSPTPPFSTIIPTPTIVGVPVCVYFKN